MDMTAILIGYAQIAISLAGFSTLATVVVNVSRATSTRVLAIRLCTVILFSLTLFAYAITPLIVSQLGVGETQVWHVSALAALTVSLFTAIAGVILVILVVREKQNIWWQTITATVSGYAGVGALGVAYFQASAFWYLLAMTLVTTGALSMIVGLIFSFPVFDALFRRESAPAAE